MDNAKLATLEIPYSVHLAFFSTSSAILTNSVDLPPFIFI